MSSRCHEHSQSGGFSLAEVLVALAIAALMAAMLVRFIGGLRWNAARIGEALEMATMAETLLARVTSEGKVQPGRTDGRAGRFQWRLEVEPVPFTAVAHGVRKQRRPVPGASVAEHTNAIAADKAQTSRRAVAPANNWIAYRVAVAVEAPSGRKHVADTVRIGPPPPAAQR